ncbi:HIT domain-containing protein [Natronospira bacteriovora]|uniref:HIT family protein n=1 Tax=Natronospira bacteriovora TaxID=3069753 RepID=A0ABU0W9V5_9GAMM|nr:HIT family protein [Natronospira sp. AB-CW4]MDQ2070816.1 HIT family protein [Natronospira sp. AB-CW4]
MSEFQLHPRLQADCHVLGRSAAGWLLLQRNATLPWYLMVPESDERELQALPAAQRQPLMEAVFALAAFVKQHHGSEHTNMAAIGNLVPQLHVHVVGRYPGDACWPGVVWGNLPAGEDWSAAQLDGIRQALNEAGMIRN